jgi:hypothetical protein
VKRRWVLKNAGTGEYLTPQDSTTPSLQEARIFFQRNAFSTHKGCWDYVEVEIKEKQ